jgi:hypothetical protein
LPDDARRLRRLLAGMFDWAAERGLWSGSSRESIPARRSARFQRVAALGTEITARPVAVLIRHIERAVRIEPHVAHADGEAWPPLVIVVGIAVKKFERLTLRVIPRVRIGRILSGSSNCRKREAQCKELSDHGRFQRLAFEGFC